MEGQVSSTSGIVSKSRQPRISSWGAADMVSVYASSATSAPSHGNDSKAMDVISRTAEFGKILPKPLSVTLQNNSACLTQCPAGYKLRAYELPYPRANTAWEELAAVLVMLAFFTFGLLLPFLVAGCVASALAYRNVPAMLFLAVTAFDCVLPPGKVRLPAAIPAWQHLL